MGARSVGRECALMILFAAESAEQSPDEASKVFFAHVAASSGLAPDAEARAYAAELIRDYSDKHEQIDERIRTASTNWRLERMSRVDRNVLRLGTLELASGVPRAVAIDEAVELAKRFGSEDSSSFVNGVLSKIADDTRSPA